MVWGQTLPCQYTAFNLGDVEPDLHGWHVEEIASRSARALACSGEKT